MEDKNTTCTHEWEHRSTLGAYGYDCCTKCGATENEKDYE